MAKSRNEADARYVKKNVKRLIVKLYKSTDADIIEYLEGLENKQGTVKKILRDHIQKGELL